MLKRGFCGAAEGPEKGGHPYHPFQGKYPPGVYLGVKHQWLYDYMVRVNSGSDIICDVLEGNESVVTDIDFELQAKT